VNSIYRNKGIQTIGAAVSWDTGLFVLNFEGAAVRYMDKNLNILRYTGRKSADDIEYDFSAGINTQVGDNGFLALEYYRHNWGIDNDGFSEIAEDFYTDEGLINYLGFGLQKDYLAASFSWSYIEKYSFSAAAIFGLNDGSVIAYPSINYIENSGWDLSLGYVQNFSDKGNPEGYFCLPFYNTVELKFNAYF